MAPCGECGYSYDEENAPGAASRITELGAEIAALLEGDPTAVRARPSEKTWSALEYGCHVRDVCRLFDQRAQLMLSENDPRFANWDQDATAVDDNYGGQDAGTVADELVIAAARIATRFDGVKGSQWGRRGRRSDGANFTVETFARYLIHDPIHHLWDVEHLPDSSGDQGTIR